MVAPLITMQITHPEGRVETKNVQLWFMPDAEEGMYFALARFDPDHFAWEAEPPCWQEIKKIP